MHKKPANFYSKLLMGFHMFALVESFIGIFYVLFNMPTANDFETFGGKFKFLTIWNMVRIILKKFYERDKTKFSFQKFNKQKTAH